MWRKSKRHWDNSGDKANPMMGFDWGIEEFSRSLMRSEGARSRPVEIKMV